MADTLSLLALLDSDPDDAGALAALQAQATGGVAGPALEALAATRARMRERGRPDRALALLDLELGAVREPKARVPLLFEKARILDEDLLDVAGATAAYKDVLALDKKHEDAGDAQSQLALGKKNDNWKKFAAKFTAEAQGAGDSALATSLYLSAAEQWGRFAPGKPEIVELLRKSLAADPGNRKASLHLERVLRAGGRWAELAAVMQQRLDATTVPAERVDLALALADLAHDHLGDDARALALGRQVLAGDPAHPRALARVVHALEAQRDWAGLAQAYATALRARGGDGDPGLLLQAGMVVWKRQNDLDAAEDYFRRLRRLDPAHPAALDFYRAYHGAKNEPAKLVAILRQAEKALPPAGSSPATDSRARALAIEIAELSETGTPDKAIDAWKQMLRLDPTSSEAREALKRLYRKAERWNALLDLLKDETERLPAADLAGKKERLFEMIAIYRDRLRQDPMVINTYNAVLKLDPDDARAADELAEKYRAMGRWQDLINLLGRKAELGSVPLATRVALLREVADLWLERFNNQAQAVRPLERLLELAPSDLDAITKLKDIYGKRRQWRPLIGLLGREADLLAGGARQQKLAEMARLAAERAGDPRLAIEIHNRIVDEHGGGGDDETLAALAALYERDKRWLALAEILDRQRKRAKRPAEAVLLLEKIGAILADRAHAPGAAAQVWSEILAIDPGHAKALRTLRELYAAAGDWDGLEGLYGRLGQYDELVDALFALGDRQDDRATRLGLFRRAAAIAGKKPDSDRVIRAWERVLAVDPHDPDAARALIPAYTRAEKWAKLLPLREALLARAADDEARLRELSEIRTLAEHKLGSKALALTWTARAFAIAPDDPALVDELLRLAQQPEQWREVAATLGRAADDPARPLPTRMRLLRTLAGLYGDQLDDDDAARTAQRKLLALTPDDPAAALAYEELSERLADWPELLGSLRRRADRAAGDDRRALLVRIAGIEEEKLADLDAAALTVGKILELAPADPATLASLARLHEARGDWEGLAAVLSTQLATDPAAAGGRGALHLRLGAIEEGSLERPARGLDHYLAALALAAEGAEDAPAEHVAVTAVTRYLDPTGPGAAIDEPRRREVAAAVEPYLRRAADAATLARALEVLAGGAAPGSAEALTIDRRLVGLYHQLAQPERAWQAAARVVAGDPADDEARASLTALAHDLDRAPELAQHLAGALDARRQAGATSTEIRALAAELAHLHADELGDPAGAERGWKVVLEVEPDDAEAFTALADLYRQGERWAELRELLERRATAAVSVDERRSALIEIATLDEEIAADAPRAIDTYRRLLDVDPGYLPAYKALDRLYADRQDWGELDAILERSFDSVPAGEQVAVLYRRAALHARHLGDPAGAVDLLEDVVTRAPGHADARELLEELLAVPALRQRVAVMLEPLYVRDKLWKDLTGVLRIQREAADSPLGALELLARVAAVEEEELGNLRAAFDTWSQALAADPSDPRPAANLVRLAARTDRWGDAARALEDAATDVEPHVAIPLLRQLAEIADISLGDNPRAIAAYQRLYEAAPTDPEVAGPALVALAGLYSDEERWPELDRALHLHAESAPTADARARLLAQAAELEEGKLSDRAAAIATWNQILADDAEDERALYALERLYQAEDRWKDLADNLRRQADRAQEPSERIGLLRRLAELHEVMLEDPTSAISSLLEILDHDGEDAAALDELARLYQEQDRPADRLDILERRLGLADARGEADVIARRHELALLLAGPLGREPEALDRWSEVLARDPGHEAALAAVQKALGDPDLAGRATAILEPLYEATGKDLELTELLWQTAAGEAGRDRLHRQVRVAQIREHRLGDKPGAFAALEAAVRTAVAEPELPELLAELDRLAADLGREADLIAVYRDIADDVLDGELQRRLYLDIADLARAVSNDAALAATYYHKVLDSQPDDRRALGALESIYRAGGAAQAEELYKILGQKVELVDTDPADRKAALAEMAALAGGPLGRSEDAVGAWQQVLELDPSDALAGSALEGLYRDQGRWTDLIDLYERRLGFVDTIEEAVALRVRVGQVHEQELRDLPAAAESYAAALSGDPAEPTALGALERMLGDVDVRSQAAEVLEPIYIARQDWPRLVRIYEVRLDAATDPAERLELTRTIARLHEEQLEDLEGAFGWFAKVLREDPSEPEVRGQLHRLATILELWPQLAAVYQSVLDDDRGDSPHLRAIAADLADIYDRRLDRWEPGAQAYLRALAGFQPGDDELPSLPQLFAGLETLYTRHRQWKELATAYGEAILAIDDEAWRRELQARQAAVLEHRLADPDGAIDAWRGVLASAADGGGDGEYARAAVELDRLYRSRARWYDLAELLTERLAHAPQPAAQVELRLALAGVLEHELHDASAAVDQYQEVLASPQPEPAAAALERLLADPDQRGRAAGLLEPYYRKRDAWPRLVALLEHQVQHEDDPETKIVALLEVAELHDVRGGDAARALDALARAWQLDPARKEVFERLVHHGGLMSAWDQLVQILEQGAASTHDPEASTMALARVAELHEGPRDDRPAAIAAWRKVLAVAPDDDGALHALDRLLAVEGRPAELVAVVERRAELAEDAGQRLLLLHRVAGLYEEVLEQPREAVAAYKNVLAADDTDAGALDALDRLYRQLGQPRELAQILERKLELADDASVRRHLRLDLAGVAERDLGDGYEAINHLQAVLADDPTDDEALAELDRLYQANRMWPELLDVLERRSTLADDGAGHAELVFRAAQLAEHELGDIEGAIERYGEVLALVPDHAGARAALEGLLAQDSHLLAAAELLAHLYRQRGDHDALARVLERRLEGAQDPEERRNLWASLADVHETLRGDLAAAAGTWARALTENPADKALIGPLERLARVRGAWPELATLLEGRLATGLEPELEHDYAMRLGHIYEDAMAAPAQAATAYERAAATLVDEAAALAALDRVLWRLGKWDQLGRVLERLAELSDDAHAADLTFRLGDVRESQLGDRAGAIAAYRAVVERDHGHRAARSSLERLLAEAEPHEKVTIIDTLEPLYEADGEWRRLVELYAARLEVVEEAHERASIYRRIANLAETRTHDVGRALDAAAGWLAEDPTSTEALAEVDRLAGAEARWFDVAGWVEEIAGKAGETSLPLWMYAGTIQLDRLGDPARATASFHQALALDPDHLPALEALERTHRSMGELGPLAGVLARQAALAFDPSAKIELWREVANLREATQDDDGAIAAWESVVELADDDRDPLAHLARIHERRGDKRSLVRDLERAAAIAGGGDEEKGLRVRIARLHGELGDPSAAASAWQTVLDLDPGDAGALAALEELHVASKDWMAVQDLLARRLDLARTSSEKVAVLTRMAELAERERGAIDDAIAQWYAVLDVDSSTQGAYEQLERLLARSGRWHDLVELLEKRADVHGTLGDEAAELGTFARAADIWEGPLDNPDEAGVILEKILRREPDNVAALTRLARIHERTGDRAKASEVLERALALGPTGRDAADLFFRLGELAAGDGDGDLARTQYRQALEHEPAHAGAIAALERVAREAGDWPLVADMLERRAAAVAAGGEGDAIALAIELAGVYGKLGKPEQALPALERAAAAAPTDARVLAPLADLYVAAGQLDRAAPIVERLAEDARAGKRMKDVARYRQRQGTILEARGDAAGAMAAYEEAFRIAPTDVPTMAGLGRLAMQAKDWEKARRVYRALVLQNLDDSAGVTKAGVYLALGQIHVELGEGPKAKGMFQRGLELEPNNPQLKDALARL